MSEFIAEFFLCFPLLGDASDLALDGECDVYVRVEFRGISVKSNFRLMALGLLNV